mgnify:CR=1 FL=1
MKLVIIDYGMGNLYSLQSTIEHLGIDDVSISNNLDIIYQANKILLPGVGSFVKAMTKIKMLKLDKILDDLVLKKKIPILGICLGMQLLCNSSEEDGGAKGLAYIDAECKRFDDLNLKVPHVGFNQVQLNTNAKINDKFVGKFDFYFTHSYRVQSNKDINSSLCNYGEDFVASFEKDNIVGTQFHPELSQTNGLKMLKNFLEKF